MFLFLRVFFQPTDWQIPKIVENTELSHLIAPCLVCPAPRSPCPLSRAAPCPAPRSPHEGRLWLQPGSNAKLSCGSGHDGAPDPDPELDSRPTLLAWESQVQAELDLFEFESDTALSG